MDVTARMEQVVRTLDLTNARLQRARRTLDRTAVCAGLRTVVGDDGWRVRVEVHPDGGVAWHATRYEDGAAVVAVNPTALIRAVDERMRLDGSFTASVRAPEGSEER